MIICDLARYDSPVANIVAGGIQRAHSRAAAPMVARASRRSLRCEARKVALLGAGGGIGQPLALLLKMNKFVTELALYDIVGVAGVAADLSHCNTPVKVGKLSGNGLYVVSVI